MPCHYPHLCARHGIVTGHELAHSLVRQVPLGGLAHRNMQHIAHLLDPFFLSAGSYVYAHIHIYAL